MDRKEISSNPLEITKAEKYALQIYGGTPAPRYIFLDEEMHDFINSLFFEGMDSELTRIFEDDKCVDPEMLNEIESVIEIIENLYSAMYKYGKTVQNEQTGYRVDRKHTFQIMLEKLITPSNISTSMDEYHIAPFEKGHSVLLEIKIKPGTPCVDYQNALHGEEYNYFYEKEILIAPFCKITNIEELEILKGFRRFRITVSAPEKEKPLTEEEQNDKKRQLELCYDCDLRNHVQLMLEDMKNLNEAKPTINSLASAKQYFSDKEIEKYSKWKNAVLAYLRYRFREISLEIEAAIEQQKFYETSEINHFTCENFEQINEETVGEMQKQVIESIKQEDER